MHSLVVLMGLAITLFASSNADDLLVLVSFFSDPALRPRDIVIGQYAGLAILFGLSFALSLVSLLIPMTYVGVLGIFPIFIGVRKLVASRAKDKERQRNPAGGYGQIAGVALVTLANGGDNIGIYVPAFAVQTRSALLVIALVFAFMVALWCLVAHWMVNHAAIGAPIRRYAHILAPVVLIGLGFLILYQAGTLRWLGSF